MTEGPTPAQVDEVMSSSDPISTMLGIMPDDQLEGVARAVVAECARRGLDVDL